MITKSTLLGGVIVVIIGITLTFCLHRMNHGPLCFTPLPRWALSSIFDGKSNPLENPDVVIEGWPADREKISHFPAVSDVTCLQDLYPFGVCCDVRFGEETGGEVHIWWEGPGKYRVLLKFPPPVQVSSNGSY